VVNLFYPQKHKEYFKLNGLIGQAAWEQNKLFYTPQMIKCVTSTVLDAQPKVY
jgi:signal recognition particle GTPase